jgi:4-hydroxy-2-oxoglutarate aldolase
MPNATRIAGIIGPVTTPFNRTGDALDLDAFTTNLQAHIDAGLAGIVVAGSTGEATLLRENERATLLERARNVVPRNRLLLAGVGAESTWQSIERAKSAATIGADAVLVVAPHYYPQSGTADALLAHYTRIADESPVPVLLYNIPQYMHYNLPAAVVRQLAEHPNIVGMKDSGGDVSVLSGFLAAQSAKFSVLTGNASILQQAIAAGVRGGILAVALFVPGLVQSLIDAVQSGRTSDASAVQAQLLALGREIVGAYGPAGVKAALDVVGLRGGAVRSPLRPLDASAMEKIRGLLEVGVAQGA